MWHSAKTLIGSVCCLDSRVGAFFGALCRLFSFFIPEKHKMYHQKDEMLARDGFKKFMKYEPCSFAGCPYSHISNHIHCIRPGKFLTVMFQTYPTYFMRCLSCFYGTPVISNSVGVGALFLAAQNSQLRLGLVIGGRGNKVIIHFS
jgi:hypothetical protein